MYFLIAPFPLVNYKMNTCVPLSSEPSLVALPGIVGDLQSSNISNDDQESAPFPCSNESYDSLHNERLFVYRVEVSGEAENHLLIPHTTCVHSHLTRAYSYYRCRGGLVTNRIRRAITQNYIDHSLTFMSAGGASPCEVCKTGSFSKCFFEAM